MPENELVEYINQAYKQDFKTAKECCAFAERYNEENEETCEFLYINQYVNGE